MKNASKLVSLLLAMVLTFSLLGGAVVYAGGENLSDSSPSGSGPVIKSYKVTGYDGDHVTMGESVDIEISLNLPFLTREAVVEGTINSTSFAKQTQEAYCDKNKGYTGDYILKFDHVEYLGGGNQLTIELSYPQWSDAREYDTINLTIAQCDTAVPVETPAPEATPTPEPQSKTPNLIIKESSFGGTEVEAGQEFTLSLTLFTTSGTESLTDVLVGLSLPKDVTLASGNMNTYVGTVGPEGTRTITYQVMPGVNFIDGVASIGVTMSGIGEQSGQTVSSSNSISIPVTLPERFEITNMEAPEVMMLGEEGYLSVTYVNKGKGRINNLSAEIQGENLANPGQSQFIGNVEPGTENSVDFSVMASAEGTIQGTVILSYEDDRGEVKTLQKEFSCTVEPMPEQDPGMDLPPEDVLPPEAEKAPLPGWVWMLIGAGGAGLVAVLVSARKKKKEKALSQLEDEDEDL